MNTPTDPSSCTRIKRHGFTLIELLVVISIIALLVSILLPALSGARDVARRISCASNVRQHSIAMFAYAYDYKGDFPQVHHLWLNQWQNIGDPAWVESYHSDTGFYSCPSADPEAGTNPTAPGIYNTIAVTRYNLWMGFGAYPNGLVSNAFFGFQGFSGGTPQYGPAPFLDSMGTSATWNDPINGSSRTKLIAPPSEQPFIFDMFSPATGISGSGARNYADNHAEGRNMGFGDGHGSWEERANITRQVYRHIWYTNDY